MLEEILEHLDAARRDDTVRVLVLSSTDHMGLSAGADVREKLDDDGRVRRMELFARVYDELTGFPHPTVAACHGSCVGGGAEVAVACDLRVGGSNLRLRFPGGALGVPVGPARLVTLCGLSVAKYLLLTGKEVSAEQALRWGLVHRVAPAPATEEHALDPGRLRRRASARGRRPPEAHAPRVGRRRGPHSRRGRGAGGVAALRPRASVQALSVHRDSLPAPRESNAGRADARRCAAGPPCPVSCRAGTPLPNKHHDEPSTPARRRARGRAIPSPWPARSGTAGSVPVHMSAYVRPYLLAALAEAEEGFGGGPVLVVAADDIGARDLASELRAYLARRVRYYPSRGTGYASHVTPPPHLIGLRIAALDALAGATRRRRPARGGGERRGARRGCPGRLPAPGGLHARARAPRSIWAMSAGCWSRPGTSTSTRSRSGGSSRIRGGSSTSSRPPRSAPPGWSCSATRSSRSAGSRPSPSAPWARST